MKIKMLETQRGSVDGCRVDSYEQGAEYDLSATQGERELAAAFVGAGMAKEVGADQAKQGAPEVATVEQNAPDEQPTPERQRGRRKK